MIRLLRFSCQAQCRGWLGCEPSPASGEGSRPVVWHARGDKLGAPPPPLAGEG